MRKTALPGAVGLALVGATLGPAVAAVAVLPGDGYGVDAPGLTAGPFITGAGVVWESSAGITLTDPAGDSTVLAPPDAANWDNYSDLAWFGLKWWAIARPTGVSAGRIGGRLSPLPLLAKCNPASPVASPAVGSSFAAEYAISGRHLYAALPPRCLTRRGDPHGEVVDFNLDAHRRHVLAALPGVPISMSVSGRYLALAYSRPPRATPVAQNPTTQRTYVRVLNAATGARLGEIRPPRLAEASRLGEVSTVQVDGRGDILVSAGCCGAAPGQLARIAQPPSRPHAWWWARSGAKVGRAVQLGREAVLSDGRVAYFPEGSGEGREIDVTDLLAGRTKTVVTFAGSAAATGLALSGNGLAWAQQSTVIKVERGPLPGGGSTESCVPVALSPVELSSLDLRFAPSSPVLVSGAPVPAQYDDEPPCIER